MRELPSPYYPQWSHSNEHDAFTRDQVLAIQSQAYEDGLREVARLCSIAKPIGGRAWSTEQLECFECLTNVENKILDMLVASQKETK